MTRFHKKLWLGLVAMAVLSPLGIYLPAKFGAGEAWGEWAPDALKKLLGYVPEGLEKLSDIWKAPVPDYNVFGEGASFGHQAISYIMSGFIGMAAAGLAIYLIAKMVRKNEK
jgi:hypothetical protein